MKRVVMVLSATLFVLLAGCSFFPPLMGSGRTITSTMAPASFSRVAASQACDVTLVPDTISSVQVTCDDNLVEYLSVGTDAFGTLRIGLDPAHSYSGITFKAVVHAPSIVGIDLSGASRAVAGTGFSTASPLSVTLSGASTATLTGISCPGIVAEVSGASTLTASGSVGVANLVISGASTVDLLGSSATGASVNLSGASTAKVNVAAGTINLSASGLSVLYYRGSPTLNILDLSGGSSVAHVY